MNTPSTETTSMRSWQEEGWEITPFNLPVFLGSSPDIFMHFILSDIEEERQFEREFQAWDMLSDEALINLEQKLV